MPRTHILVAALCATTAQTADAQRLTFDSASKSYRLTYYSDDLRRNVTLRIQPPNKVDPRLELVAARRAADGRWEYEYRLTNLATPRATQRVGDFEMPCDKGATATGPRGWTVMVTDIDRASGGFSCTYSDTSDGGVAPGASRGGFVVRTSRLPAIAPGKFWGTVPPVVFPDGEDEHDEPIHDLLRSVNGTGGGWLPASVIAPARDTAGLTTGGLLQATLADLQQGCGAVGLITVEQTCTILRAMLEAAARAHRDGTASVAKSHVATFLAELDLRRGRDVPQSAYWLLRMNAQEILSRL